MKIYTRKGDEGMTDLYSGERISKTHLRMDVCGTVDELNAALGSARAASPHSAVLPSLEKTQSQLFVLGADLATPGDRSCPRVTAGDWEWLEAEIDLMTRDLPPLRHFILPGGTPAAAQIHLARAVCRRAERQAFALTGQERPNPQALSYLNRLSDFLFTLARYENFRSGAHETIWKP